MSTRMVIVVSRTARVSPVPLGALTERATGVVRRSDRFCRLRRGRRAFLAPRAGGQRPDGLLQVDRHHDVAAGRRVKCPVQRSRGPLMASPNFAELLKQSDRAGRGIDWRVRHRAGGSRGQVACRSTTARPTGTAWHVGGRAAGARRACRCNRDVGLRDPEAFIALSRVGAGPAGLRCSRAGWRRPRPESALFDRREPDDGDGASSTSASFRHRRSASIDRHQSTAHSPVRLVPECSVPGHDSRNRASIFESMTPGFDFRQRPGSGGSSATATSSESASLLGVGTYDAVSLKCS